MKLIAPIILIVMAFSCNKPLIKYPETRKDTSVNTYFETKVEDPYCWLEDDNSVETETWVKAQNEITFTYLESLPNRQKIKNRLTELWNFPRVEAPFNISGRWFVFKNNGLQNQSVLYTMDNLDSEPYVLLDPNKLSDDGTVAYAGMDVSFDGKYLVYKIARSGSDWNEIYVKNIETGDLLSDHIKWVKFSDLACYKNGFFYSAYDKPEEGTELSKSNSGQKIMFHQFGNEQIEDKLIFSNPNEPMRMYTASLDEEKENLFIVESESTSGNGLFMIRLGDNKSEIVKLATGFNFDYIPIDMVNGQVVVLTNNNAPKYKVVSIDPNNVEPKNWNELIPENENTLEGVWLFGHKFFAKYMVHAKSKLKIFSLNGKYEGDIELPGICTVDDVNGTYKGNTLFYSYSSYNTPGTILKYDIDSGKSDIYFEPDVKFNPNDFVVKQEFYTSKDGTKIPMFIFHRKGLELNGKNPTMLYGYGGFNVSLTPSYATSVLYYVERGGVYVVANLRGGGEYGEDWHKAGTLQQKQNVFDDFISGAEYLIESGYTNSDHLAIRGGSNGGLLIGAVTNQRPDLFKVALPAVGVMDMLKYHQFTIGYAWATDYGRSDDSADMFKYLLGYSPIHNIEAKKYPAILVTTADHDDRVVPAHSFKYIARMQEMNTGNLPTLIRIDVNAGHGSGKPTAKIIEEYTDLYAFVFHYTAN